jgi:hypothetical protein
MARGQTVQPHRRRARGDRAPLFARLAVRRTIIPILLTLAALLPAIAIVGALSRPEAPLHLSRKWVIGLIVMAALSAAVAGLNMLAVRRQPEAGGAGSGVARSR